MHVHACSLNNCTCQFEVKVKRHHKTHDISFSTTHLVKGAQLFAAEFKLTFNATKTQLVCFRSSKSKIHLTSDTFLLDGHPLHFSDTATHLGHLLHYNLDDTDDVARVCSEMCRKANSILHTFGSCSPPVKNQLVVTHCLSLFGSVLWRLDCRKIKSLDVAFNNLLRRIWKLPRRCHTGILHCITRTDGIYNIIIRRCISFIHQATNTTSNTIVRSIYNWASSQVVTATGYNLMYRTKYLKQYSEDDYFCAQYIRDIQLGHLFFDTRDTTHDIVYSVCCD